MQILNEFGRPYEIDNTATTLREPDTWLIDWVRGGKGTASGVTVNETTAMKCAAVYACVRNLCQDIPKLPLILYQRLERGKRRDSRNPLYRILRRRPNREMSSFTLRSTVMFYAALCGNGYAEIVRTRAGTVQEIWPLENHRVRPDRDDAGRLIYWIKDASSGVERPEPLQTHEMLHIASLGIGQIGFNTLKLASESIGTAIAADEHAGAFFGNHAMYSYFLSHPQQLSDEAHEHLKRSYEPDDGARGAYKVKILEEGMKVEKLTVDPRLSQLIESRQHGVEDVCRFFRQPPHKVGHLLRTTFSNIEESNIDYVVDTLMPWTEIWEQEITEKLIPPSRRGEEPGDLFAEHLFLGLLRGNQAARASYYAQRFNIGSLSPNDIRELENENPIDMDGADDYYVQGALRPIDEPYKAPGATGATGVTKPKQDDDESVTDTCTYCVEMLASEFDKLLQLEQDRVSRAAKKPEAFDEWLDDFYGRHVGHVGMNISPTMLHSCRSMWTALGNSPTMPTSLSAAATSHAQDAAKRHCDESKTAVKRPGGWDDMRGRLQAAREVESLRKLVETFAGEMQ